MSILKSINSELEKEIKEVIKGEKPHILIHNYKLREVLPNTPYRGLAPMFKVKVPEQLFIIDEAIKKIARIAGVISDKIQSNIDSFNDDLWSPPLNFHFDRGAGITILGCLCGELNKYTILLPVDTIVSIINDNKILNLLNQPSFLTKGADQSFSQNSIPLLSKNSFNSYIIHKKIILSNCEINDLQPIDEISRIALLKLADTVKKCSELLLSGNLDIISLNRQCAILKAIPICLSSGDILVINNSLVFHGRTAGFIEELNKNRWLRAMFIDYSDIKFKNDT